MSDTTPHNKWVRLASSGEDLEAFNTDCFQLPTGVIIRVSSDLSEHTSIVFVPGLTIKDGRLITGFSGAEA